MINEKELIRYSRHILLPEFGMEKQTKLKQSHVAIIGCGGLGTPAALYLAASGVGHLTLIDFDRIALENLQRQIGFTENDIDRNKAEVLKHRLQALNSQIEINTLTEKLTTETLSKVISNCDLVIDATDNFASRFSINHECFLQGKLLVSGAAIGWQGQLMHFDFKQKNSPCYQCVFPALTDQEVEAPRCSESSVISPLVGIIGSMQALSCIKLLTKTGDLQSKLQTFDGLSNQWCEIKIIKDSDCEVCGKF